MQDLCNLRLDWDVTRINSVYQIEMLDVKDLGDYIHHYLLPDLQKSYKHAKQYLPASSRKNIYSIKKLLADLIENQKHIQISNHEDYGSEYFTKYEALFLLSESLNLIQFFAVIVKEKYKDTYWNSEYKVLLQTIMKLTQVLRKDIDRIIEFE